jgi:hypothetical protein
MWSDTLELIKKVSMPLDRRKHTRYDQMNLELSVSRRGIAGFLRLNPTADCLDFSLSGLQFGSNQAFNVDDKLVIDIRVRDIEANELNAVVVEAEELKPGFYCTRVRFCFLERHMKNPRIMHALLQIEDRLRVEHEFPQYS